MVIHENKDVVKAYCVLQQGFPVQNQCYINGKIWHSRLIFRM